MIPPLRMPVIPTEGITDPKILGKIHEINAERIEWNIKRDRELIDRTIKMEKAFLVLVIAAIASILVILNAVKDVL